MGFKVAARTILHLGAELIGSDAIAIYELVKNAFDAKSEHVDFSVVVRIPHDDYKEIRGQLLNEINLGKNTNSSSLKKFRDAIVQKIDLAATQSRIYREHLLEESSLTDLLDRLDGANYIRVEDFGYGMSKSDLEDIYLTIGTSHRLKERKALIQNYKSKEEQTEVSIRPILGEKGVGRLSAMRLGDKLYVKTTQSGEQCWNTLRIDWSLFSHESDKLVEEIDIKPKRGSLKDDPHSSGTILKITALSSAWDEEKLKEIGRTELNKLTDPFTPSKRYPINLFYNSDKIRYEHFNKILFKEAHAIVNADFYLDNNDVPLLKGRINYRRRSREKNFIYSGIELLSITEAPSYAVLKSLGPFTVEFYWYNRKELEALDSIGTKKEVQELVNSWSGGLKVYRDGFRVNPYGNLDDDWLKLDKKALASSGYKVNKSQIIGKVDITNAGNPKLVDQTNREGLMDCREKEAFVLILQYILKTCFKRFLDEVDKEVRAREPVKFDDFVERVNDHQRELRKTLEHLAKKYPMVKNDTKIFSTIGDAVSKMNDLLSQAGQLAEEYEEGRTRLVHMAGLGLMVETIAHELNRATSHALLTLHDAEESKSPNEIVTFLHVLESQLKTLQKRLRILDPLSTRGRQKKELFDLVQWVRESVSVYEAQFKRHNIEIPIKKPFFTVNPPETKLKINAVKGMVVQILENLISNSIYWIKQQQKLDSSFKPEINIKIDTQKKELYFTDNGPGIDPQRAEEIFQPFVSSKPPDEGKGLGLFISREIAEYHGAKLYLSQKHAVHKDRLNTFVLAFEKEGK